MERAGGRRRVSEETRVAGVAGGSVRLETFNVTCEALISFILVHFPPSVPLFNWMFLNSIHIYGS